MDIQSLFAERIGGAQFGKSTAIYKFEKIKRAKRAAREAHPDVEMLDFGVGEPDQMAPRAIRQALKKAVDDPANRGYADNGIAEFRVAAAKYMADFFGVTDLDPATEINHTIGSKPALAMIPFCFVNPGDALLATIPGYPVMATHTKYLGGTVIRSRCLPRIISSRIEGVGADRPVAREVVLCELSQQSDGRGGDR